MKHLLTRLFGRGGCPGAHDCLRTTRAEVKTLNLRTARMHERLARAESAIAESEASQLAEQAARAAADTALSARIDRLTKPRLFSSAANRAAHALFRRG